MADHNHDFISVIRLLGRPVSYYPSVCHAFGEDIHCAMFLSNFYGWEGKQRDKEEGWIFKSQKEIKAETGLNRYCQEKARKKLKEYGIIEEKLIGRPPVLHYRFNWNKMNEVLNVHFNGGKAEKNIIDPMLFRLKTLFCEFYTGKGTKGIDYTWVEKDWRGIKDLSEIFRDRIIDIRRKSGEEDPEHVEEDEIVNSFNNFLVLLPQFYLQNRLTPLMLVSDFNTIILKMRNGTGNSKAQPASTPTDYV